MYFFKSFLSLTSNFLKIGNTVIYSTVHDIFKHTIPHSTRVLSTEVGDLSVLNFLFGAFGFFFWGGGVKDSFQTDEFLIRPDEKFCI